MLCRRNNIIHNVIEVIINRNQRTVTFMVSACFSQSSESWRSCETHLSSLSLPISTPSCWCSFWNAPIFLNITLVKVNSYWVSVCNRPFCYFGWIIPFTCIQFNCWEHHRRKHGCPMWRSFWDNLLYLLFSFTQYCISPMKQRSKHYEYVSGNWTKFTWTFLK